MYAVYHVCAVLLETRRPQDIPWDRAADGCESPSGKCGLNLGPRKEQLVLLTVCHLSSSPKVGSYRTQTLANMKGHRSVWFQTKPAYMREMAAKLLSPSQGLLVLPMPVTSFLSHFLSTELIHSSQRKLKMKFSWQHLAFIVTVCGETGGLPFLGLRRGNSFFSFFAWTF